jgi:hypothetical protein
MAAPDNAPRGWFARLRELASRRPGWTVLILVVTVGIPLTRLGCDYARQAYVDSFPTLTVAAFLAREDREFDVIHNLEGCLVVSMPDEDGESVHYRLLPDGRTHQELVDLVKRELRETYPAMTLEEIREAGFSNTRFKRFEGILLLSHQDPPAEPVILRVDYGGQTIDEAVRALQEIDRTKKQEAEAARAAEEAEAAGAARKSAPAPDATTAFPAPGPAPDGPQGAF